MDRLKVPLDACGCGEALVACVTLVVPDLHVNLFVVSDDMML